MHPINMGELVTTVALVAIAAAVSSTFAVGAGVGLCMIAVVLPAISLVKWCLDRPSPKVLLDPHPLNACLLTPIIEEGIFRGLLLPLSTQVFTRLLPEIEIGILGAQVALASLVAVVAIAVIFGLYHLTNNDPNTDLQALFATVSGAVLGLLAVRCGLVAAVAAHMVNNTASLVGRAMFSQL